MDAAFVLWYIIINMVRKINQYVPVHVMVEETNTWSLPLVIWFSDRTMAHCKSGRGEKISVQNPVPFSQTADRKAVRSSYHQDWEDYYSKEGYMQTGGIHMAPRFMMQPRPLGLPSPTDLVVLSMSGWETLHTLPRGYVARDIIKLFMHVPKAGKTTCLEQYLAISKNDAIVQRKKES